jgi:hypothetical protein
LSAKPGTAKRLESAASVAAAMTDLVMDSPGRGVVSTARLRRTD